MRYASLINRIKAVVIDGVVILIFATLTSAILSQFETVPDSLRIGMFLFIFLLYDPLFTSIFGATLGHLLIGLKVRRVKDESRKVIFPLALLRFLVKALLGWISLLTISGNTKSRAIHDLMIGSVVLKSQAN